MLNFKKYDPLSSPDIKISAAQTFGIDIDFEVPAYSQKHELVPEINEPYCFDKDTTLSILAGFAFNKRVLVQGFHGTGKSTHIEQVAARLNWPCVRVNLDSQISRIDLVGRDAIIVEDDKQVTSFQEGLLPWSLQFGCAFVFDEYDAGRPDVMFVIQRVLEHNGSLTLPEQNRIIAPHDSFRLFATANTVGLGDTAGLYHGTNPINQGQMDRWNIVAKLDYLSLEQEFKIVRSHFATHQSKDSDEIIKKMIDLANLTRLGFMNGDISIVMSPRTVINWFDNYLIFSDLNFSFRVTFLNRSDEEERELICEYFQRAFNCELDG